MPGDAAPLYLNLLVAGLPWTLLHCGGMCGPLVVALRVGEGGWRTGLARLAIYQGGRGLVLAGIGAICGLAGDAASDRLDWWGPWFILAVAALMLLGAVHRLGWLPWLRGGDEGALATRLLRPVAGLAARHPRLGLAAVGAALAALPCGIVFWILGLAVASHSPIHGALLMLELVAITTLPLALAALLGAAATGRLRNRWGWVPTAALLLSAGLLGLHGAAALGWIHHLHVWKLMLW